MTPIPPWLAPAAAALTRAILAEDAAYWGRAPTDPGPLVHAWYRDAAWPDGTPEAVVLVWSAETHVGPRDYHSDCRRRLDDVARRFAAGLGFAERVSAHVGETCGTMQLAFTPTLCS